MANINVQNEARSDFDLNTLFSDSELVWEHDELDFDLGMMSDWTPSPRVSDEKETTQQRAETLALMDEPFPLNVSAGEDDGSVNMYDDEELARKQLLEEVESESEEEDPTMEDVVSQEESAKEGSETDEEDAEEARGELSDCWGCHQKEFINGKGLCWRCDKDHKECTRCSNMKIVGDNGHCYDCRQALEEEADYRRLVEEESNASSESSSESEHEDNTEDVEQVETCKFVKPSATYVKGKEQAAEDGRWYCHDPNCNKSTSKKQDLKFHILGDARGGHGARFDKEHPLRWRNGALFIDPSWDPYKFECEHCEDLKGYCKGYVNYNSLLMHYKRKHPCEPEPEKKSPKKSRSLKRRRVEGPSVLTPSYELVKNDYIFSPGQEEDTNGWNPMQQYTNDLSDEDQEEHVSKKHKSMAI